MRWHRADHRRLVFASALTVLALPAVWLANRDAESSSPNVAAVGLPAEDAATVASVTVDVPAAPAYLQPSVAEADAPAPPASVDIAVGAGADVLATVDATFRAAVGSDGRCWTNDVSGDERVTVYNPANGRSITCRTMNRNDLADGVVVLTPAAYAQLADLTRAPAHVEIRR